MDGFSASQRRRVAAFAGTMMNGHRESDATPSISISMFGSGKAWTTQVVRAG